MSDPAIIIKYRQFSTKIAQDIASEANKDPVYGGQQAAGVIGCLVLQNILCSLAMAQFKPGSKEGHDFLAELYQGALTDAKERWNRPDLKAHAVMKNPKMQ